MVIAFHIVYFADATHYHLELQGNPAKNCKKAMLFPSSMGEMGLSHGFLKYSQLGLSKLLRSNHVWGLILRLQPWNFLTNSESMAANLEKVR